jgi:protease I
MKSLSGKKVLMVIAKNKFRDEEYLEPRKALEEAGAVITVASSSLNTSEGLLGLKVKPDVLIGNVKEEDFDGIVFIGGGGAAEYFDNPVAHKLAQGFFEHGKLTSAICIAPATLANAGVLKGKKATSFPSSEAALRTHGAIVMKQDVVSDGIIITAVGPQAAKKFGQELIRVLGGK